MRIERDYWRFLDAGPEEFEGRELISTPGFIDVQVNGFAGTDFNHASFQGEDLLDTCQAIVCTGVRQFLPTVVTGPVERMKYCLGEISRAWKESRLVNCMVPCIHLEGPFLAEGPHGAHPVEHLKNPDKSLFSHLQRAANGLIGMVTLAPELPGALDLIEELSAEGVVVALGHTSCDLETCRRAVDAGARISTHLGNGAENLMHRHHNPVQAQLGEDRLYGSFIADGTHLPPHVLKNFIRAKTVERSIMTTDCMAAAGSPPGTYTLGELTVEVGDDRIVRQPGRDNFAGSALTMNKAVANTVAFAGIGLQDAVCMASTNPARVLGLATTGRENFCLWHQLSKTCELVAVKG